MIVLLTNAYIFFPMIQNVLLLYRVTWLIVASLLSSCTIQNAVQGAQAVKRVVSPKRHFGHLTQPHWL